MPPIRWHMRDLRKEAAESAAMSVHAKVLYHCALTVHTLIVVLGFWSVQRLVAMTLALRCSGAAAECEAPWWAADSAWASAFAVFYVPMIGVQRTIFKYTHKEMPCRFQTLARNLRGMKKGDNRWAKDVYILSQAGATKVVMTMGTLYGLSLIALLATTAARAASEGTAFVGDVRTKEVAAPFAILCVVAAILGFDVV